MQKTNKPKFFVVFKIIGILGICIAIAGFILAIISFKSFNHNNFMVGGILSTFGFFIGMVFSVYGFSPEIAKLRAKTTRYIQENSKEELTDIASNSADISSEAVTKITKSVKKGLKDEKFCKHCGEKIDANSKFCNNCGKKQ